METTADTDRPIFIDMTNEVNRLGVRAATALSALRFEVKTGMKMCRIAVLPVANEIMGTNFRTKAKALAALEVWHAEFKAEHGIG